MTSNHDDGPPGYGNPPKAHRFKPGQSGNPRGRRKEGTNQTLHGAIHKRLQESVTLRINGKRQTMARADLIVTQLVNKAATGDLKALETLIKLEKIAPAPDRSTDWAGAADRLVQKFRVIQERREKRAHDGQGGPAKEPNDKTSPRTGDTIANGKMKNGGQGSDQEGETALQSDTPEFASKADARPESTEGGGFDAVSEYCASLGRALDE